MVYLLILDSKVDTQKRMLHIVHPVNVLIQFCSANTTTNMLEALVSGAKSYGSNTEHSRLSFLGRKKRPVRSTTNPTGKESSQQGD